MAKATYRSTITADNDLGFTSTSYTPDSGATPGAVNNTALNIFWDYNSPNYFVTEAFFGFDLTSPTTGDAPTEGSTITAATLNMYLVEHGSIARTIDVYAFDWSTAVDTDDWRTVAQLQALYDGGDGLVASYNIPSGWGGAEGNHDFTSGSAAVSAVTAAIGGTLRLMLAVAAHRAGTTPTARGYASFGSANNATESYRPLLTVEYTAPAGFTGLTVTRVLNG